MLTLRVERSGFKVLSKGKRFRDARLFPSRLRDSKVKRYLSTHSDLPRPPSVPFLGSLPHFLKEGGQANLHKYVDGLHKNLGPIFANRILGQEMIFLSDPDSNLQVYTSEGPHPEHFLLDAWVLYLKTTEQKRGLFFMDGKEWQENRKILNKILLVKNSMANHVQKISSVCKDFMNVWKVNPPGNHLEYYLYSWNIECIGEISINQRLGYVDALKLGNASNNAKDTMREQFVESIYKTFLESANLYAIPAKLAKSLRLGAWNRFYSAVTTSLILGNKYVEKGIKDCKREESDEGLKNSLVYKLIKSEKADEEMTKRLLVDLFLASADTTSHTAAWMLYLLGRSPAVAQKAREEIFSLAGKDKPMTLELISDLKYVNGIIREALRLYPIATFLTRKLAKDTNLCGYSIPAGKMVISSLYTMGRNPEYFSDPENFRPERWFRGKKLCPSQPDMNHNRRAYIPWGLGGRSCIGKRIAELDLSLLVIEALKNFEWTVEEEVDVVMRMVAVPSKNIKLNLTPI